MADETNDTNGGEGGDKGGASPEKKPEIAFKTKAEFHAEVDRKTKSAVAKATEDTTRKYLEALGIESEEELASVVETVKKGKTAVSETEALKQQHNKLTKDHAKLKEGFDGLLGWKRQALVSSALSAYSGKTVDLETLSALVVPKLSISDDDSVTGPNGMSLEDVIEGVFKLKPFLKVPDNTAGAGTKPGGGKSEGDGKPKKKGEIPPPEDKPANGHYAKPAVGSAVVAALMALKDGGGAGP